MQRLIDNDYLSAAAELEQLEATGVQVDMEDLKTDENMLCPTSVERKVCPTRLFYSSNVPPRLRAQRRRVTDTG